MLKVIIRTTWIFSICVLVLSSCLNLNQSDSIQKEDIAFIESLKSVDTKRYLTKIDSSLSLSMENDARLALLYLKKGKLKSKLQHFDESIKSLERALVIFKRLEDKTFIAQTYYHLGSAEAFLSNRVIANEHLLKALEYSKAINDKKIEADTYGSLSHVYYLYEDYETSIDYSLKTIDTYKTLNDTSGLSSTYNNIAVIYKNTSNFDNALVYNKKSLELSIIKKDTNGIAKSYNNIGNVLNILNKDDEAIENFMIASDLNHTKGLMNSSPLLNLGDVYLKNDKLDLAKIYYLKALIVEDGKKYSNTSLEINNKLLQIAKRDEDHKEVYVYQLKVDSLNVIKNEKDTKEKLDLVKKQFNLAASQQELLLVQEINTKNKTIFLFITFFLIVSGISWFLYYKNRQLKNEKEKILLEQRVLRSQMNPHFIFNALSSIQNSLMDNDPIKSAGHLSKFAKLIRQNFDFINKRTITLSEELNALENYIQTQLLRLNDKFEYAFNIQEGINIDFVEIPPLLLQPFIENSIEHGFRNITRKGKLILNITKGEDDITFEIIDNGKGYEDTQSDEKVHSIDIFKKRLKLMGNKDEKTFLMVTSKEGTTIKFSLKQ